MKLSEYLIALSKFVENNPGASELDVVIAKDAVGNGFELVYGIDGMGNFQQDEGEFTNTRYFDDYDYVDSDINAICIN